MGNCSISAFVSGLCSSCMNALTLPLCSVLAHMSGYSDKLKKLKAKK